MSRWLRNAWYIAAWADEVAEKPVARRLLDEPVVLFRDADGTACAAHDRCPHRFAPLSLGMVSDGALACRYHGLRFGADGGCVHNPHGSITRALRIRTYPVAERHHAIWIWMGDPQRADMDMLPDLSFLDAVPSTAFSKGYLRGRGDYRLFTDNILDLTHADFLHPDTLGGGTFTRTRAKVTEKGNALAVAWQAFDEPPSPMMASRLGGKAERVDCWTEIDWSPPAIMALRSGAAPVDAARAAGASSHNLHAMTPESADTTHYFYAATRDYALGDYALNQRIAAMRDRIFATEDEPVIAAQSERIGTDDFWDLGPALMAIDEAPVRARRILDRLIAAEACS